MASWDLDQLGNYSYWMTAEVDDYSINWDYGYGPEAHYNRESGVQTWEEFLDLGEPPFSYNDPWERADELIGKVRANILARVEAAAKTDDARARRLLDQMRNLSARKEPSIAPPAKPSGLVEVKPNIPAAQYNLGVMYDDGIGVEKSQFTSRHLRSSFCRRASSPGARRRPPTSK